MPESQPRVPTGATGQCRSWGWGSEQVLRGRVIGADLEWRLGGEAASAGRGGEEGSCRVADRFR